MHFIDVGFKQSGSSENNNCYFETIFYGLNESLEEVDLYKWQEIHRGIEVISQESVLENLTSYECDELLDLIESKKENYFNNFNSDFINKISDKNVKIKKRGLK